MASNAGFVFQEGDEVEVWSNSRKIWFVGVVEDVAPEGGSGSVAEGSIKVRFGKKLEKWILPKDFGKVLRRHVPRVYTSDPAAPPPCVISLARTRFYRTPSKESSGWLTGASGNGQKELMKGELADIWIEAVQKEFGEEVEDAEKAKILVKLGVVFASLGRDRIGSKLTVDEWIHHSLLLIYPPGHSVKTAIGRELANNRSSVLSSLVKEWLALDKTSNGRVLCTELEETLKNAAGWSWDAEEAKALMYDMDGDGFASVCYCDFAAKYLRLNFSEVCLSWYDLTGGWSKYISPLLLWHQEGGIWHTGIVIYGREYYYSGRIFRGRPGATPFGMPTKIQRLGLTIKTAEEFRSHLSRTLDQEFTEVRYDVLDWNCNHFTDKVAVYLLEQQIPDEIRLQPERAMNAPMVKMLRPMLNQWLGRIEGDAAVSDGIDADAMPPADASTLDAMARAKSILGSDRVVLYMPPGHSKPIAAQVQKRYRDGSCDIAWYERGETEPREAGRVPASKLKEQNDKKKEDASCSIS